MRRKTGGVIFSRAHVFSVRFIFLATHTHVPPHSRKHPPKKKIFVELFPVDVPAECVCVGDRLVTRGGGRRCSPASALADLITRTPPPIRELHHTFKWTRPLNH